jgi:hypothetical protein
MTRDELIAELQKMPENLEVFYDSDEYGPRPILYPSLVIVCKAEPVYETKHAILLRELPQ